MKNKALWTVMKPLFIQSADTRIPQSLADVFMTCGYYCLGSDGIAVNVFCRETKATLPTAPTQTNDLMLFLGLIL